tara:strand:- start:5605 stop:7518 length:1914 start_codon:yes stop_codon:yes gene_type:complete
MADPNPYVIEFDDFSERFQRNRKRKLAEEEAAMSFYDNFVEVNGPFTQGVKGEMQKLWTQIEDQFTLGNATPQGKSQIKKLYNDYKNLASDALNFSTQLGTDIALIQQNPSKYKNPEELLLSLQEAQSSPVSAFSISQFAKDVPKASDNLMYKTPVLNPGDAADNFIKTFSEDIFYNNGIKKTKEELQLTVDEILLGNTYNDEDIASMISSVYEDKALLERIGGMAAMLDIAKAEEGTPEYAEKTKLLNQYKEKLTTELFNRLDARTESEDRFMTAQRINNAKEEPEPYFISNVNTSSFKINDEGEIERGELRSYPFAVDLKKSFKQTYKNKELDIDRVAFDGLGNLGFIVSETIINPLDDEEFVSTTFVPQENIPGALARVQKTNPGIGKTLNDIQLQNAPLFQKNREKTVDDSSGGVAKAFKNNKDINVDELADAYNKREEDKENYGENLDKNFGNKQPRLVRKYHYASQDIFDDLSEEDRLIVKTRAEEMKKNDSDKKASSVTKKFKSDQSKKTKRIDTALNEIRILGNQDVIDEANLLLGEFIKTKTESITSQDISNDKKITLYGDLAKDIESKLKTLDRYNNNVDLKPLSLDQVKSFIEDLSKKKYQEGGKVSEQSPLGRIFNRFRKALTQS